MGICLHRMLSWRHFTCKHCNVQLRNVIFFLTLVAASANDKFNFPNISHQTMHHTLVIFSLCLIPLSPLVQRQKLDLYAASLRIIVVFSLFVTGRIIFCATAIYSGNKRFHVSPIFSLDGGKCLWETMDACGQNDNNMILCHW